MNVGVIGGADGPTEVFITGSYQMGWINVFGLILVVAMLLPNIVFAFKYRDLENKCKNKVINVMEQIGRYGSMFLMIFNIGLLEFGFASLEAMGVYFIGNSFLMLIYWVTWLMYFHKPALWKSMTLAIAPILIFLLSGLTLRHYLLTVSALVFGVGHIYITYQNSK